MCILQQSFISCYPEWQLQQLQAHYKILSSVIMYTVTYLTSEASDEEAYMNLKVANIGSRF